MHMLKDLIVGLGLLKVADVLGVGGCGLIVMDDAGSVEAGAWVIGAGNFLLSRCRELDKATLLD